jgi:hypothetical protein
MLNRNDQDIYLGILAFLQCNGRMCIEVRAGEPAFDREI